MATTTDLISMKLTKLFADFFDGEKAGGIILLICAAVSIFLANSSIQNGYVNFWKIDFVGHPIDHWVNEGLMAIFFLLIGLELEREIYVGKLSNIKSAALPIFAAIGGMIVPAGIYLLLNYGTSTQSGTGIPMATDIAFALAALSLLGKRVPIALKVFLTALAVIDDLGAILTIAIFYSKGVTFLNLGIALGIFVLLGILNRLKVRNIIPYLFGGIAMWYFMLHSGVHATIAGVLLAFVIPFGKGDKQSMSYRFQQVLLKPVTFIILPLFALANTAITVNSSVSDNFFSPVTQGIFFGLLLGKPIGIFLFTRLAAAIGLGTKPEEIKWRHILGVGLLGGVGFTISIFVTFLAFTDVGTIDKSKVAVIISSTLSAIMGVILLKITLPRKSIPSQGN